jgi:hypothetical protein
MDEYRRWGVLPMTIVRRQHNSRFASLPNAIWEDPSVSVEAKGVLGYLLSRPHDWNVRQQQVGQVLNVGKDKLQRIFRELIDARYVTREQIRDESTGSFGSIDYIVRDETVASLPQPEKPQPVNPQPAKPQPVNTAAYKELKEQKTESTKAADDACAREPSKSLISPEAFSLVDDLLRLQRLERDDPRSVGTAYGVQAWLSKGWSPDVIRQAVESVMARRSEPPRTLRYFEAAIAEAHAERDRPLPIANPPNNTSRVANGTHRNGGFIRNAIRLAQQASDG